MATDFSFFLQTRRPSPEFAVGSGVSVEDLVREPLLVSGLSVEDLVCEPLLVNVLN